MFHRQFVLVLHIQNYMTMLKLAILMQKLYIISSERAFLMTLMKKEIFIPRMLLEERNFTPLFPGFLSQACETVCTLKLM